MTAREPDGRRGRRARIRGPCASVVRPSADAIGDAPTARGGAGPARRRVLGRSPGHQPRADHPARVRAARRRRDARQPPPGRRRARGTYQALQRLVRGGLPVPRHGRLQVARGGRLGAGAGARSARSRPTPTRPSRWSRRRSGRTATSTALSRSSPAASRSRTWPGATSCTASATSSRRPWPGIGRSATTGCWPSRRRAADAVDRALGPGGARRDRRPSRDRDGARRAVAGDRRATATSRWPRGRSTCAATACWATGGSGAATGRTTGRSARPPTVAGHAVRQLYLDAGAVDVAVETGDRALLDAVIRRWTDMVATRTYLTGGLGSRHRDEAFGDPYELPPDRAYAETCAAIASVMLAVAAAAGDRRAALRRPDRADDLQRRAVRPLARRDARSSTSTRSSGGATGPGRPTPTARGRRGTRAPAARPT